MPTRCVTASPSSFPGPLFCSLPPPPHRLTVIRRPLVQSVQVPDRDGNYADVVLGKAAIEDYVTPRSSPYFGALIGRVAGRIRNASFSLNNKA